MKLESCAVITRSNITWYYAYYCRDCGRISFRERTHKGHPIPRPDGRAMGYFVSILEKLIASYSHHTVNGQVHTGDISAGVGLVVWLGCHMNCIYLNLIMLKTICYENGRTYRWCIFVVRVVLRLNFCFTFDQFSAYSAAMNSTWLMERTLGIWIPPPGMPRKNFQWPFISFAGPYLVIRNLFSNNRV